ncbi:sigma factor G inhibitor Gin [Niallia sp. FSL W8-0635]|uniref:sigma factor G inhibitor Gin n=1 Tax=Niallia sp. FSL W8-0635 TaxID=2975337 RepID=UPI0009CB576E|nr:Inhibitor of sigma-G Gin [Mycobacteroides abscessus subsp. abscessus]HEO8421910.1 sigma factor G inhibitor Gin [Yersinia enterocolitica]
MGKSHYTQSIQGEKCLICEKNKLEGIHLFQSFICMECEREIVNTKTNDPKYQFFVYQMGKARILQERRQA